MELACADTQCFGTTGKTEQAQEACLTIGRLARASHAEPCCFHLFLPRLFDKSLS